MHIVFQIALFFKMNKNIIFVNFLLMIEVNDIYAGGIIIIYYN